MRAKFNERLVLANRLKPDLIALIEKRGDASEDLKQAAEVLKRWDNFASVTSRGAVLFADWWVEYSRELRSPFKTAWSAEQPLTTPTGIGDPDRAIAALSRAVAEMKKQYGDIAIEWGAVHRLRRGSMDLPVGGWNGTFRAIGYTRDKSGKWIANFGDRYVLAVEFTNPPTAYSVMAYSQSSNSDSKHFNDQTELFAQGRFKPLWFTEEDIRKLLERAYHPGE
jgi:acyl-homoserine-lactone acylase